MIVWIAGAVALTILVVVFRAVQGYRRQARALGYVTLIDYLRAVPGTDGEKRHAVDMVMQGLVLCVLGLAIPPFLLIGIFPLYFGGRKVSYSMMGLGLIDDSIQPED
jgi:hypothetical protein